MFPPLPEGQFDLIAADPPWRFNSYSSRGLERSPENHYKTVTLENLCQLPVRDLASDNCHLMLWITCPTLAAGHHMTLMKAWGFTPTAVAFVWVKTLKHPRKKEDLQLISSQDFKMGLGHTTRQNAELVMLGRRGRPKRFSKAVRQIIAEPCREHSRKPESFFRLAEQYAMPNARRLELFARKRRPGWTVWGNEIDKFTD